MTFPGILIHSGLCLFVSNYMESRGYLTYTRGRARRSFALETIPQDGLQTISTVAASI
jgi:hypothetical protein